MPFLDWVNRNQAVRTSAGVPYHLLKFESSHGDESSENLLIQGDNLKALKALMPFYRGKVKCIYIDPPYNTQSAFAHYDDKLEHSQWLSMMYPRMELLRDLLSEDGVIFVSIDDREAHYLKVMMDEVFGRSNYINTIAVKMSEATGVKMAHASKRLPKLKEFILFYKKNETPVVNIERTPLSAWNDEYKMLLSGVDKDAITRLGELRQKDACSIDELDECRTILAHAKIESLSEYFKKNNISRAEQVAWKWENAWRIVQLVGAQSIKKITDLRSDEQDVSAVLSTQQVLCIYYSKYDREVRDPRIRLLFAEDYLTTNPGDFWQDIKTTGGVGQEGGVMFPNGKKPEALIKRIIGMCTQPNDLILDIFLGSGTTAAVAQKMERRWIGVEMGEHARTHCIPRLEKVIAGEQGGISETIGWTGGGGFRFHTVGEPVFDADGGIHESVRFAALAAYLWHFETGEPAHRKFKTPLLGVHNGTAYHLLYNGILGDRRPEGGNVLTGKVLEFLETEFPHAGPRIVYGETTRLGEVRLRDAGVTFKQIPYDIKAR